MKREIAERIDRAEGLLDEHRAASTVEEARYLSAQIKIIDAEIDNLRCGNNADGSVRFFGGERAEFKGIAKRKFHAPSGRWVEFTISASVRVTLTMHISTVKPHWVLTIFLANESRSTPITRKQAKRILL